jgi:hypothetical protein
MVAPHAKSKLMREYQSVIAYLVNDWNDAAGGNGDATLAWRRQEKTNGARKIGINRRKNTSLATDHSSKTHEKRVMNQ